MARTPVTPEVPPAAPPSPEVPPIAAPTTPDVEAVPTSAELEAAPRRPFEDTAGSERVVVRAALRPAYDDPPPPFPATARVLPGNEVVSARPAQELDGERREVEVTSRVLHDGVDYRAGSTPLLTQAQFVALRDAGACDGVWL